MAATDTSKALAEMARVEEDRWIMEQRRDGATLDQISQMTAMPPALDAYGRFTRAGGIGRRLAEYTVGERVRARLKELVELTRADTESLRAQELERLDVQVARTNARVRSSAAMGAFDYKAEELLAKLNADRRKLLGVDVPVVQKAEVAVTIDDARSVELAAMLEAAAAEVES